MLGSIPEMVQQAEIPFLIFVILAGTLYYWLICKR